MKKFTKVFAVVLVAVMAMALLVACAPAADPDKALAALKENEYTAAKDPLVIPAALALLQVKGVDTVVSGSKSVKKGEDTKLETVTIVYFTDAAAAKAAWEKVGEYANDQKKEDNTDWVVGLSGAMIYWGTSAGVRAAR